MERMERTVRTPDAGRPYAMRSTAFDGRPRAYDPLPDVPAWDLLDVPSSTIDALREEVSALRERLANTAPKRAVVEMDKAVNLLAQRMEEIRSAGAGRDETDRAFAEELAAIRGTLEQMRQPERLRALETGLDAVCRKIELVGARAVDPVEVARLQSQVGEIRDLVTRSLDGPQGHDALEQVSGRIAACAEEVFQAGETAARRVAEATSAFERNAETLLARVMQAEGRARAGDAAAMEELRRSLIGALQGVHRRLDQVADHISEQVSGLSPAVGAEVAERLNALAHRMAAAEEAGRSAIAPLAEAMDRQFSALSDQLRATQAQLGRLDDIEVMERHLASLSEQFHETRGRLGRLDDLDAMERHLLSLSEQFRSANARFGRLDGLDAMERHLASLSEQFRTANARFGQLDGLDAMERHLASLSEQFHAAGAQLGRLDGLDAMERRIAGLSEQFRAASAQFGRADGTVAMERHIERLSEQFREAHARLDRLDNIETSIARMAEEMSRVREATHSATAEAVAAVTAKVAENPDGAAVVGLKRGLAALEARQDEIERRTGEILAVELEHELSDISVSLGRDDDGTFAPRATAGEASPRAATPPHAAPSRAAPDAPQHPSADFVDTLAAAVEESLAPQGPAQPTAPKAAAQKTAAPASGPAAQDGADTMFDIPWPHAAARADRSTPQPAGDDTLRPKLDHRGRAKRAEKQRADKPHPAKGGLFSGGLFARKRHFAMVALIAGATTVFTGIAAGLIWRNGPDLVSGLTQAARRLSAPAVAGVTPADLPPPVGPAALQSAARGGDPSAAFRVAARYADGQGVEANLDYAVKWLGFAIQRGSAPAAHRLGALYESAGRDLNEAKRFYQWAAEQGNVRAMQALAMLLSDGTTGQKPDWAGAIHWFRAAAELGYRDSQYNLGVVYARGLGVAADLGEAYKWLSLAAAQGDEDSARKRDIIAREADGVTMLKAQKAVEAFSPAPLIAAANTVEMRPEWEDNAGADKVAAARPNASAKTAAKSQTHLASAGALR